MIRLALAAPGGRGVSAKAVILFTDDNPAPTTSFLFGYTCDSWQMQPGDTPTTTNTYLNNKYPFLRFSDCLNLLPRKNGP